MPGEDDAALRRENARLQALVRRLQGELDALRASTSWRLTAPVRALRRLLHRRAPPDAAFRAPLDAAGYADWLVLEDAARRARRPRLVQRLAATPPPRVALLLPLRDPPPGAVEASVAALHAQLHGDWQLCLVDCGSTDATLARRLAALADDPRIRVRRQGDGDVAAALRLGLAATDGALVGLLEAGARLTADALADLTLAFAASPGLVLAFADEDRCDEAGTRSDPVFKPGWSPELLLADPDAIGRPWLLRRATIAPCDSEYALLLHAALALPPAQVAHLPRILCHRPHHPAFPPRDAAACARAALAAARREDPAAEPLPCPHGHGIRWSRLPGCVSVIIPTRDRADLLQGAAAAVLAETGVAVELLIVDNGSTEPATAALLRDLAADPRVRVLPAPGPFNWSALNNAAARAARGEVLVLLNNDIAALAPGWLEPLARAAMRPGIGVVGATLLYPDGTVQHAGIGFGADCRPVHLLRGAAGDDPGYRRLLRHPRDVPAVTGACLAIRAAVLAEIGGLDESFPVACNDVDLCRRATAAGYRVLWLPEVRLQHLEAASRGDPGEPGPRLRAEAAAFAAFTRRWSGHGPAEPRDNPNLDLAGPRPVLLHPSPSFGD